MLLPPSPKSVATTTFVVSNYGTVEGSNSYGKPDTDVHSPDEARRRTFIAVALVCGMVMCETLARDTFNGTQTFFLGNLQMDAGLSDGMHFARDRIYMIFLLLCAKLGDRGLGRFWTILLGAVVYFSGTAMVSLATHPWISRKVWYLAGAFVVLPFGQAAISSNVLIFGADQFNTSNAAERRSQNEFFWWLCFAMHCGAFLSHILLAGYGISEGVSHYLTNDDWQVSAGLAEPSTYYTVFIASAASFVVAIAAFAWGKNMYSQESQDWLPGSSIVGITQYLVQLSSHCSFQGVALLTAKVIGITIYVSQAVFFWSPVLSRPLSIASAAGVVFSIGGIILFCQNTDWLDGMVRPPNQPLSIPEVKAFLKMLPLIVCAFIVYGCFMQMMKMWYVRQACQMDLRWDRTDIHGGQMFSSIFEMSYSLTVIVGTPLALYIVNPRVESVMKRIGLSFTEWPQFIFGAMFGLASALTAAYAEVNRRGAAVLDMTSNCAPQGVGVRSISARWMLIPYILMGISSLYAVPALSKVAYMRVPRTVRSMTIVTTVFMMSASQSLVMAMSVFMKEYTPHDLDTGHLEYLYFLGILVSGVMFTLFASVALLQRGDVYQEEANKSLPA